MCLSSCVVVCSVGVKLVRSELQYKLCCGGWKIMFQTLGLSWKSLGRHAYPMDAVIGFSSGDGESLNEFMRGP